MDKLGPRTSGGGGGGGGSGRSSRGGGSSSSSSSSRSGGGGCGGRRDQRQTGAASKADDFDHAASGDRSGDDISVSGVDKVEVVATFDAMGLDEDLLRGIYAYGFEKPSAIQQRAILPIMRGRDVIAQSQSGTGKTAVFSIGILQTIDTSTRELQALALSPTRELAEQTQKVILALGDYMSVACHVCIGGTSVGADMKALERGVHVVSGTPGRVFDMIRRRCLDTRHLKMFVIDEADEMLNQGFKEQIYEIYRYLPPASQVVLISATMPQEILTMTKKFMTKPVSILVKRDELTLEGIKQFFVAVEKEEWKFDTLCDLYVFDTCCLRERERERESKGAERAER